MSLLTGGLVPDDDLDLTEEQDLALALLQPESVEDLLGLGGGGADLTILDASDAPEGIGRSWAYDVDQRRFLGRNGPLETTGLATLRGWIAKCLATERDSLAIHPPGYGVEDRADVIGSAINEGVGVPLEERVRDALTFHPAISDVADFTSFMGEGDDDDVLYVNFTVVTNLGDEFAMTLGAT